MPIGPSSDDAVAACTAPQTSLDEDPRQTAIWDGTKVCNQAKVVRAFFFFTFLACSATSTSAVIFAGAVLHFPALSFTDPLGEDSPSSACGSCGATSGGGRTSPGIGGDGLRRKTLKRLKAPENLVLELVHH